MGFGAKWPQGELWVDSFHLRWQPGELWNRRIVIRELFLHGLRIQDRRPETGKISFEGWPQRPFWLSRLQGEVESFRVQKGIYQRGQADPVSIQTLSTGLLWNGEFLRVRDFTLDSSLANVAGTMEVGFSHPRLNLSVKSTLAKELAGLDSISFGLNLEPVEDRDKAKERCRYPGERKVWNASIARGTWN
jgi:hypothetical protein